MEERRRLCGWPFVSLSLSGITITSEREGGGVGSEVRERKGRDKGRHRSGEGGDGGEGRVPTHSLDRPYSPTSINH